MNQSAARPRILHCHSTFDVGGKERRAAGLMNAFGSGIEHTIVSAMPEAMSALKLLDRRIRTVQPRRFPSLKGWPTPGRLVEIAKAMQGYDLVLTYNWGAMDAVLAHTVFAQSFGLPPLIHHEDGFNEDEAEELKASRNWYRRIALSRAAALVVPSRVLERIASRVWKQPGSRIVAIANGIDTAKFARKPRPSSLRIVKRPGERWVGTLAGLRPVKELPSLVEAFARLPEHWNLVIVGEGSEQTAIRARAAALEIDHRVHLPGAVSEPADVIGLFDIFALSSRSEQFPLGVAEAMAAGLPVAAPDVGDIAAMVSDENQPFIAARANVSALGTALETLASDEALRGSIGAANRARATAHFDESAMIEAYGTLYERISGRALTGA